MISNSIDAKKSYSLLGRVEGAEKALLSGHATGKKTWKALSRFSWSFYAASKALHSTKSASRFSVRQDSRKIIPITNWRVTWEGNWQMQAMR
jgi:hypothetical protein